MTKIDLSKISGLPIAFEDGHLIGFNSELVKKDEFQVDQVRSQLLNNEIDCQDTFFCKYFNLFPKHLKHIQINGYVIFPNLAGIEYPKTKAYVSKSNSLYEVIFGGGVVLLQDFVSTTNGKVYIGNLKKGMKFSVPANIEFSISNTKLLPLIVLEYTKEGSVLSNALDDMRGMSYYVIRKNAKFEVVKNPHYRFVAETIKYSWEKFNKQFGITLKTPLKKQIEKNYEKIAPFFNSNSSVL